MHFCKSEGNDFMDGGAGDDVLFGDVGDDLVLGGAGVDIFVFGTGDGADSIGDFEDGIDLIDISGWDPAVIALVTDPFFTVTIAPDSSYTFTAGAESLRIENNFSLDDIILTADDFI